MVGKESQKTIEKSKHLTLQTSCVSHDVTKVMAQNTPGLYWKTGNKKWDLLRISEITLNVKAVKIETKNPKKFAQSKFCLRKMNSKYTEL